MIDLTGVQHHPAIEEIVEVLCNKTQNTDRNFFRTEVAYFLAKMAGSMRAMVVTKDRGEIPVNVYAVCLASSGFGKGHSVNILEDDFMGGFRRRFMDETMPVITEHNLWNMATTAAVANGTDQQTEFDKLTKECRRAGSYAFTFDDATVPAVKQMRHKLLLTNSGAINLQIDEIGLNLLRSTEVLTLFLELYDQGMVKQKLTKSTVENERADELVGKTPTNMLLFGAPSTLFDASNTEAMFHSFLETGYARRCLFGFGLADRKAFHTMTPEEIYNSKIRPTNTQIITKWSQHFHSLADPAMMGWRMTVEDDVGIALVDYQVTCERIAEETFDQRGYKRAELAHRHSKAIKLAGALAFVDGSNEIEMDHLKQAILIVEESGRAFQKILETEKSYMRLAKYIAGIGTEVTHADLDTALPYYKAGVGPRTEMMSMAIAWGYRHHIVIRKTFGVNGIEFFKGETLKATDLQKLRLSYSDHWAYNYEPEEEVPFDQMHTLMTEVGMNWANHLFNNKHRAEENVIPRFNMVVLDVDGDIQLETVHDLLKEYVFMTYTTKRHTPEVNRFRVIIPINYELELDADEYKEFMRSLAGWVPFKTDESTFYRSKKWLTHEDATYYYNLDGELLDALPFIPNTAKNDAYRKEAKAVENLDNLERWFAQRIGAEGSGRNNQMIKYALALVDSGFGFNEVSQRVHDFNKKLQVPLSEAEINSTILVTAAKKYQTT
jgi:hypothetical protein